MSDPLLERLARCCVRVRGDDTGSGFYVAPNLVLTCAHVVGTSREAGDTSIVIDDVGATSLICIHPDRDDDIALLETTVAGASCVWLSDEDVLLNDAVAVWGYPEQMGDTRTAVYEGVRERPGGLAGRVHHNLKQSQIIPGFSGAPVVNLRTGAVIGVLTDSRSIGSDLGGGVVAARHVHRLLSGVLLPKGRHSPLAQDWTRLAGARHQRALGGTSAVGPLPAAAGIDRFLEHYRDERDRFGFGGRRTQMQELDAWLGMPDPPYGLIVAPAGRGKSSLLVNWLDVLPAERDGRPLHVVFVPVSIRFGLNTEKTVLRALAARLATIAGDTVPDAGTTAEDLRDLCAAYLNRDSPAAATVLVIVDGADEADGWELAPDLFPARPGAGVKVLISARQQVDRDAAHWASALGWTSPRLFEVPFLSADDLRDVLVRTPAPLSAKASDPHVVAELHRVTDGGDPLLVGLYLQDLRQDPSRADRLTAERRPSGLASFFDAWRKQQETLWGGGLGAASRDVRLVFNLLAVAVAPLERGDLIRLARIQRPEFDGDDLDEALRRLARFVLRVAHEARDTYGLAHPRFADYRREQLERDGVQAQYEALFLGWGKDTLVACGQSRPAVQVSPYIVRFLGRHLERASAPAADLADLLTPAWRRAWDAIGDDYDGFYRDARLVLPTCVRAATGQLAAGEAALALAPAWHAAYVLSERASFTSQVDPQLLGALVRFGIWSARRGLTVVPFLETGEARAGALAALLPHLPVPLLPLAEQQLTGLRVGLQESVAPLTAYCERLHHTGSPEPAIAFARSWQHGVARAVALVTLGGLQSTRERRSELVVDGLRELPPLAMLEADLVMDAVETSLRRSGTAAGDADAEWMTPGLTPQARAECLGHSNAFIEAWCNGPADDIEVVRYRLPWLRRDEAARLIDRLFEDLSHARWDVAIDAFVEEIPPFLSAEHAEAALALAREHLAGNDRARAMAALLPVLPEPQRPALQAELAGATRFIFEARGSDARVDLARRLTALGFAREVLDELGGRAAASPYEANSVIAALAGLLDPYGVRRGLRMLDGMPRSARETAWGPLLGRLAAFGPTEAVEALGFTSVAPAAIVSRALQAARVDPVGRAELTRQMITRELQVAILCLLSAAGAGPGTLTAREFAGLNLDSISGRDVALVRALVAHLSPDALVDDDVWNVFAQLGLGSMDRRRAVRAFCHRVVPVLGHDELSAELVGLGRASGWMWVCLVREAAMTAPDFVRAGAADKGPADPEDDDEVAWGRVEALVAAAPAVGDTAWQHSWETATARLSPAWPRLRCHRLAAVLEQFDDDVARSVFADTFGYTITDSAWTASWSDPTVLVDLVRYYPAGWLDELENGAERRRSSTDKNLALAAIAVRYADLGLDDAARRCVRSSSRDFAARAVSRILESVPAARVPDWTQYGWTELHDSSEYWRVCEALRGRWAGMAPDRILDVIRSWLEAVASRPQYPALLELVAFAPGLERLGGPRLVETIAGVLETTPI